MMILIGTLLLQLLVLPGCGAEDNPAEERARRAARASGDVIVGAASPWSAKRNLLRQGMEMAVEEVNAGGGINGRRMKIVWGDDQSSINDGLTVAYQFAENMDMVAVIGHSNSYISVPASIIYEYYGLLMLSPLSTNEKMTRNGFTRIFRNIQDDHIFGKEMARFCDRMGYKKLVIYHVKNDYGRGLANAFEKKCDERGIEVLDRIAYDSFSGPQQFRQDLEFWKEVYQFDAIFLAGLVPQAAEFVKVVRAMGIEVPILGGDGLDHPKYLEIAGPAAEGTFAATCFDLNDDNPRMRGFVSAFSEKYGYGPDIAASQGYEAVTVLAAAMNRAGTTVPDEVARTMRITSGWPRADG